MISTLQKDLEALLGAPLVLGGEAAFRAYDCDAYTVDRSAPTAVVLPTSTEEVQKVVRYCLQQSVPFTPRGAGTGLSGGVLPALGGVVISTKKMTKILEIDALNRCLKAQAGIANIKISEAVRSQGLHFAPDPSSQTVATLGGNIAENAGGPHTLKYGVTAGHILGITLVTVEGEIEELGGKMGAGPWLDFGTLIVGGEGTLGIATEAWVRLTPLARYVGTALIAFESVRSATESVAAIIASGVIPAALEMMDHGVLVAVQAAFGISYPANTAALLLVECDADTDDAEARVQHEMHQVTEICRRSGAIEVRVAKDEEERAQLWTARKKGVGAMGRLAPSIVTHDGVIPRSKLPEMLEFVYDAADRHGVGVANIFHAGDGNLHPIFYFDDRDPEQVRAVVNAGEEIITRCLELGGSLSGEHGIGVEKVDLMVKMFSPEDLQLQARAKSIFNTGELCNPCKILPNQKSCVEHRRRWRGVAW